MRTGLIIAKAQPFHNGIVRAVSEALMKCDNIIISFYNYNNNFFDYDINQRIGKKIFHDVPRIAYFGTKDDTIVPKHIIEHTLEELEIAKYNKPNYFFTAYVDWIEPAKLAQLETIQFQKIIDLDSSNLLNLIKNNDESWKKFVPYCVIEDIETYIIDKRKAQ